MNFSHSFKLCTPRNFWFMPKKRQKQKYFASMVELLYFYSIIE